ncbi:hypothetical protein SAMN06272737_12955 [Blastococcus mobilis]|uniref:Uncharacterized protein n=1 Tax=Blastococcus mobilis TaxID=1938746 RepID=A0A238ZLJ9_9ACTN|nr:hypothetical protein SAMN06272737_12955 [Blastococcus mobilis]
MGDRGDGGESAGAEAAGGDQDGSPGAPHGLLQLGDAVLRAGEAPQR